MKIYINHEKGTNPVIQNAVLWALDNKIPTTLVWGNVQLSCETWNQFIKAMWHGFCEASKASHGFAMRRKYDVTIVTDKGSRYLTQIWMDEDCRGLRCARLD